MKKFAIILFSVLWCQFAILSAQELNCTVTINSDLIEGTNKSVFNTLQTAITEYVNNTRWTNMTFAEQERIECSMMLVVKSVSDDNLFCCEFTCQSRRPVYGTSYTTTLLNYKDDYFNFIYQEYDRLEYQDHVFNTNLTALLAYYCHLIIGFDMDSFSRLGGTPFFQACEDIVTTCQTSNMEDAEMQGWSAHDIKISANKTRYGLANNLMDEAFHKYREYFYEYHRLNLDAMATNVANARANIANGLPIVKEAYRARPTTSVVNTFLNAKCDELVDIFKQGTSTEKKAVYELLMDLDPTRQNTYDRINE